MLVYILINHRCEHTKERGQRERRSDFGDGPGNRGPDRKAASPAEPSGTTGDV